MTAFFLLASFLTFVAAMVLIDLGVFRHRHRPMTIPEALAWTGVWIVLALAFNVLVYFLYGENWFGWRDVSGTALTGDQAALQFFIGFLVEKSLSIDNILVFALIFAYLQIPLRHQHRLLYWGVLGAVVLRGVMITIGAALLSRFNWMMYLFGVGLLISAVRLMVVRHDNLEPQRNPLVRFAARFFPANDDVESGRLLVRAGGRWVMTPLFVALLLIESTDIVFALDSIPAVLAITRDPFLVFTSNIFAILGLRSLYFALAGLIHRLRYLKMSLVFLLVYVGIKALLYHLYPIPNLVSLFVICGILAVGILASTVAGAKDTVPLGSPLVGDMEAVMTLTYRQARRVVILVLGSTVVLIGIALIVLPGPAFVVIPLGLGILATEFAWARSWLRGMQRASAAVVGRWRDHRQNRSRRAN